MREAVDRGSLTVFRVGLGVIILLGVLRAFAYGWVEALYVAPKHHLRFWGFEWVPVPSGDGVRALFVVLGVLALLYALGWGYRVVSWALFLVFTWVELLDVAYYLNHYYLVSLLLLLTACMRLGASDPWYVPRWNLWALRAQVGLVYFFAGLAKLRPDWMQAALPLSIWLPVHQDMAVVGPWLAHPWTAYLASWAGALFDLTAPFFLLGRRTRAPFFVVVVGFHLFTWALFPIGVFPWVMILGASLFFDPAWPRQAQRRVPPALSPPPRWAVGALGLYFMLQVGLPLRHLALPGDVVWSEAGFRFAWHVMLVEKAGLVRYHVRGRESGRRWEVRPSEYLTALQEKAFATQPDLIVQLAHTVAADRARAEGEPVEVRAEAWVSLFGARRALLLDPDVDLTQVAWGPLGVSAVLPRPAGGGGAVTHRSLP
jgi:vitamin K-dependent gamma-carboxylase